MTDPIIDEIRRVRHEMSERIGHDPKRLPELFRELRSRVKNRIVSHGSDQKADQNETILVAETIECVAP